MYSLKPTTKRNIENCVSLPFSEIVAMDYNDEIRLLESMNGEKPVFSTTRDFRKVGRGNPYLARRRFKTIEDVDKKLSEICDANTE